VATIDPTDRLAFTDEWDAIYQAYLNTDGVPVPGSDVEPWMPAPNDAPEDPVHEGELSSYGATRAFVSTRDSADGEVYVQWGDAPPVRVTCDPAVETHPVVAPDGSIAYASDKDGDWDIYIARAVPVVPTRVAPAWGSQARRGPGQRLGAPHAAAANTVCNTGQFTEVQITDDGADGEYDDLWPTWTYDGMSTTAQSGIAFSRAQNQNATERGLADLGTGAVRRLVHRPGRPTAADGDAGRGREPSSVDRDGRRPGHQRPVRHQHLPHDHRVHDDRVPAGRLDRPPHPIHTGSGPRSVGRRRATPGQRARVGQRAR
jgi:hypothetical protein